MRWVIAFTTYVLVIVTWPLLAWLAPDEVIEKLLRAAKIGRGGHK